MTEAAPGPEKRRRPIVVVGIAVGVLVVVCLCLVVVAALNNDDSSAPATAPTAAQAEATATAEPAIIETDTPAPTDTPVPTDTPIPTDTPVPTPTSSLGSVGERREAGGIALTVMEVSRMGSINDFTQAAAGNEFVVLDVLLETTDRDEAPYNPFYFKLKDADGFEYASSFVAPDPSLKSGNLARGDKVRGNVAFEVKEGASGLVVSYEPVVILGGYEPIRVALGDE